MQAELNYLFFIFLLSFHTSSFAFDQIELGRQLFFDKRLSINNTISCQSCHNVISTNGLISSGTDNRQFSIGVWGRTGTRNAPTVWNATFRPSLFWDGRAKSLEQQAAGPILNHVEMGMSSLEDVALKIEKIAGYKKEFSQIYDSSHITGTQIIDAIAAYERTLVAKNSAFDRFLNGDKNAISSDAQLGWQRFTQLGCISCHGAATFLDRDYFVRFPMHKNNDYEKKYHLSSDLGVYENSQNRTDQNKWRVPSLRNVSLTAPYLHNGSVKELRDVVRLMGKVQLEKDLSEQDIDHIVAFLKSLEGRQAPQIEPQLPK